MKALTIMKTTWLATALLTGAVCGPAWATNTPKIHFEQTVYDFGKTSFVENVTGTFKFKNVGDDVLKLEAPKPSCGCTIASLKPDTLKPGETGELAFTLSLGSFRAIMEKFPTVILHALSPAEIIYIKNISKLTMEETLLRLKAAGLHSVPGGGV